MNVYIHTDPNHLQNKMYVGQAFTLEEALEICDEKYPNCAFWHRKDIKNDFSFIYESIKDVVGNLNGDCWQRDSAEPEKGFVKVR